MQLALRNGHIKCVELLMDAGVKPGKGMDNIFWAADYGHYEVLKLLVSQQKVVQCCIVC